MYKILLSFFTPIASLLLNTNKSINTQVSKAINNSQTVHILTYCIFPSPLKAKNINVKIAKDMQSF